MEVCHLVSSLPFLLLLRFLSSFPSFTLSFLFFPFLSPKFRILFRFSFFPSLPRYLLKFFSLLLSSPPPSFSPSHFPLPLPSLSPRISHPFFSPIPLHSLHLPSVSPLPLHRKSGLFTTQRRPIIHRIAAGRSLIYGTLIHAMFMFLVLVAAGTRPWGRFATPPPPRSCLGSEGGVGVAMGESCVLGLSFLFSVYSVFQSVCMSVSVFVFLSLYLSFRLLPEMQLSHQMKFIFRSSKTRVKYIVVCSCNKTHKHMCIQTHVLMHTHRHTCTYLLSNLITIYFIYLPLYLHPFSVTI